MDERIDSAGGREMTGITWRGFPVELVSKTVCTDGTTVGCTSPNVGRSGDVFEVAMSDLRGDLVAILGAVSQLPEAEVEG